MDSDRFRCIALGMKGAVEGTHMGHPDFRVSGRIFATLHPGGRSGMVKLTPEQQQDLVGEHDTLFSPENGAWGRQGCTRVLLDGADEEAVGKAVTLAWQNIVRASAAARPAAKRSAGPSAKNGPRPGARKSGGG